MLKGGTGEIVATVEQRLVADVGAALRRRPTAEAKLAGAARALAPFSALVRDALAEAAEVLVRRASFTRELYGASVRALVESGDKRASTVLGAALGAEDAGGLPSMSAACFSKAASLTTPLARAAASRHAHVSFASEVARAARGESSGAHLASIAPKIKESHRISLCVDLFVPLSRAACLPVGAAPALAVLRDSERHLGRWLVLAEVAARAGDPAPLAEAISRSTVGPSSSRAAWSLVSWALDPSRPAPEARPTAELVARLSDRPSADRDTTFLFRLAEARAPSARVMLEGLVKALPLVDEVAVRAARCLARDYGRADMRAALGELARSGKREELRGLAVAALWDVGDHEGALRGADELVESKALCAQVWSALVKRAATRQNGAVLDEARFRRVHSGWVE